MIMKHAPYNQRRQKLLAAVIVLAAVAVNSAYSQTVDIGLDDRVKFILSIFSSTWVIGIACLAFIAECIALFTIGRDNPQFFKKFMPWVVGTFLFMAAGTITAAFMDGLDESTFTNAIFD